MVLTALPLLAQQPQFWRLPPAGTIGSPTANLVLALDARTISGIADGAAVSGTAWSDFFGVHTTSTPGTAPVYRISGINGRPGVEFAKASSSEMQVADAADLRLQMPYAIWFVYYDKMRPAANAQHVLRKAAFDYMVGWDPNFRSNLYNVASNSVTYSYWLGGGTPHIYGYEAWVDAASGKTQVAYFRDSASAFEVERHSDATQPTGSANPLLIGSGSTSCCGISGILGAVYVWKGSTSAADGTGVLGTALREQVVRRLGQEWGIWVPQTDLDPNRAYLSISGAKPLTNVAGTLQRTTALPAAALGLTAWDKSKGACCTDQTPALIQPYIIDTATGIGGYRYVLIASAYPVAGDSEEATVWAANNPSNTASDWTKVKEDLCGFGLQASYVSDPWLYWDGEKVWAVVPVKNAVLFGGSINTRLMVTSTTDLSTWTACSQISGDLTNWTSPTFTTDPATGQWQLWTSPRDGTATMVRRTAPVGVHFADVTDWAALPEERIKFVNHDADLAATASQVNHVTIQREGTVYYALVFTDADNIRAATSTDGKVFHLGRMTPIWGSTQAWCTAGQYRASMTRSAAGQWLVAGSCGGVNGVARIYISTLYGL